MPVLAEIIATALFLYAYFLAFSPSLFIMSFWAACESQSLTLNIQTSLKIQTSTSTIQIVDIIQRAQYSVVYFQSRFIYYAEYRDSL